MSSRSVPTQTDKVKLSGSSVDHEAGELEVRVVQWPDTGAPSLCGAAITILCCSATATILFIALTTTICPLWCQQCTRGVAHCSNTGLYLLPSSWAIYMSAWTIYVWKIFSLFLLGFENACILCSYYYVLAQMWEVYALLFLYHTVALVKRNSFHLSSSYCHCELRLRGPYY